MHGDESPELISRILAPCIKVLHIPPSTPLLEASTASDSSTSSASTAALLQADAARYAGKAIALLLDSRVPGSKGGGTGAVFDWTAATHVGVPVIIAGGLSSDNVAEAALVSGVVGVDVSSGIEVAGQPGLKDLAAMKAFIANARTGVIGK